jgi:hypothetical protein
MGSDLREYAIRDAGGIELLLLACEATDRAASLRDQIDRDGELISTRSGLRENPGLRAELANRAFISSIVAFAVALDAFAISARIARIPSRSIAMRHKATMLTQTKITKTTSSGIMSLGVMAHPVACIHRQSAALGAR